MGAGGQLLIGESEGKKASVGGLHWVGLCRLLLLPNVFSYSVEQESLRALRAREKFFGFGLTCSKNVRFAHFKICCCSPSSSSSSSSSSNVRFAHIFLPIRFIKVTTYVLILPILCALRAHHCSTN